MDDVGVPPFQEISKWATQDPIADHLDILGHLEIYEV